MTKPPFSRRTPQDSWRRVTEAKSATLPFSEMQDLVAAAATMAADSEQDMAEPHGPYVVEYLGTLMGGIEIAADIAEMTGAEPKSMLWPLTGQAHDEMRVRYGDPQLRGVDPNLTPLNPDTLPGGFAAAVHAQEGVTIAQQRIGDTYAALYSKT